MQRTYLTYLIRSNPFNLSHNHPFFIGALPQNSNKSIGCHPSPLSQVYLGNSKGASISTLGQME